MNFVPSTSSDLAGYESDLSGAAAAQKLIQEAQKKIAAAKAEQQAKTEEEGQPESAGFPWPWVIGGVVVLGAVGTAVYFATRK